MLFLCFFFFFPLKNIKVTFECNSSDVRKSTSGASGVDPFGD